VRSAVCALTLCGAGAGPVLAYLVATEGTGGPIWSGWMTLFLLGATACCAGAAISGALASYRPCWAMVLALLGCAVAYVGILCLMFRRYSPTPLVDGMMVGGLVALLFVAGAGLSAVVIRNGDRGAGESSPFVWP
jgi:hypothetical protein